MQGGASKMSIGEEVYEEEYLLQPLKKNTLLKEQTLSIFCAKYIPWRSKTRSLPLRLQNGLPKVLLSTITPQQVSRL
jgi:hypothetical protein